jgi:DNA-binding NarL/FixJ family response regulator
MPSNDLGPRVGNRVVVADDDVLLREGIASLLNEAGYDVIGQAGDAATLTEVVRAGAPDLAIVDIRMPPTHTWEGIDGAREIRREAEGRSNSGIAHKLWISEGAVEKHVRSILAKLQLPATEEDHRRVLAVLTFLGAR